MLAAVLLRERVIDSEKDERVRIEVLQRLLRCTWHHPRDAAKQGRGAKDVLAKDATLLEV